MILPELSRSCRVSVGRVTLAHGTTFSHIDTLVHLPETTHGVPSVTYFEISGFKAQIYITKQNKLSKAHTD